MKSKWLWKHIKIASKKSEPPSFPERPLNLRARAGKIYLKIMVFLINLINFHWIFTCRLQKSDFSNFSNFCIFAAGCKKNCCKPFGLWIFIFIRSKDRASLPRKWHTRIFNSIRYIYTKFVKNYWKLYISVKPKILPEGRHKAEAEGECFAPLLKFIWT